jgi:hypothetical protein
VAAVVLVVVVLVPALVLALVLVSVLALVLALVPVVVAALAEAEGWIASPPSKQSAAVTGSRLQVEPIVSFQRS